MIVSHIPPYILLDLVLQKRVNTYTGKKFRISPNVLLNNITERIESTSPKLNFIDKIISRDNEKIFFSSTGVDENFGRLLQKLKKADLHMYLVEFLLKHKLEQVFF